MQERAITLFMHAGVIIFQKACEQPQADGSANMLICGTLRQDVCQCWKYLTQVCRTLLKLVYARLSCRLSTHPFCTRCACMPTPVTNVCWHVEAAVGLEGCGHREACRACLEVAGPA